MSMKKEIMELINGEGGIIRINNVACLKRWTRDGLDRPVDGLELDFDAINGVCFGIYDTSVKARDYGGIIEECAALTERLTKDMRAGYRNATK